MARRKKKKKGGSNTISINLAKTAYTLYALSTMFSGVDLGSFGLSTMRQPFENFKANWKTLVAGGLGVVALGRAAGKFAPRIGIKNALSVKAF